MKLFLAATLLSAALWESTLQTQAFAPSTGRRFGRSPDATTTTTKVAPAIPGTPSSSSAAGRGLLVALNEKAKEDGGGFSLSNIFGGSKNDAVGGGGGSGGDATTLLRGGKLAPHPSARDHISPLNRLGPRPQPPGSSLREPLPLHPDVRSGTLSNGMPYIILPNKSPPGRFEAHLQVFSGSSDELEPQQGIAHLTEHVAYMGSRKRELLFGTGSQTNGMLFLVVYSSGLRYSSCL